MKRILLILFITVVNLNFSVAQTWNSLACPQPFAFEISVCEANVIWTKGRSNTAEDGFSVSNDGGNSWVKKDFPTSFISNNFSLGVLSAVNATTAYVIVSMANEQSLVGVYKTTDAGDTWLRESSVFNDPYSFPNQVHFWDVDRGFAIGDGHEVYVYSFGVWTSANVEANPGFSVNTPQYFKIVGNSAYVTTNLGTLIKSSDYGSNWTELSIPFTDQINTSYDFKDANNGILVFNDAINNEVYTTSDGGITWTSIGTDLPNLNRYIKYSSTFDRYYSAVHNNGLGLAYSTDNGATWINEPSFDGTSVGEMEQSNDGTLFLGGSNTVYTLTPDYSTHPDFDNLVALYNSTNGNDWIDNTNWLDASKPLSSWHGLTVENNRVSQIILGSNNLTGSLPTEIGDFSELIRLDLCCNTITGEVPSEIGNLSKLNYLNLSPNTFSGTIPTEIGNLTNLEVLWLNQNGLTGNIPQSFENLINLQELYLIGSSGPDYSSSTYSGDLPDLTGLPLLVLDLSKNYFEFEDIAAEFDTYVSNIPTFNFSPQFTNDPEDSITQAPGSDITLTLTDVEAPATPNGRSTQNNYQWFKDEAEITGANENTYTINNAQVSDSGIYYGVITNPDFPDVEIVRASITLVIDGALSNTSSEIDNTSIYPNPVNKWLNIKLITNYAELLIHDINGKLIIKQAIYGQNNALDISNLTSGIYVLTIETNDNIETKRIIKR